MRSAALAVSLLIVAPPAFALDTPPAGAADTHIRIEPYSQFNITNLIGEIGRQTTITFGKDEQVSRIVFGSPDGEIWEGPSPDEIKSSPLKNNLPLWPQKIEPTNMQVTTILQDQSQRVYQFRLTAQKPGDDGSDGPDVTFGLIFTYPEQAKEQARAQAVAAAKDRQTVREASVAKARLTVDPFYGKVKWDYIARPNHDWRERGWPRPSVSDNGWLTAFEFKGNVSEPAIYIVDNSDPEDKTKCLPGGSERLAPFTNKDDLKLVQTTARHFRLRLGDAVMEVCNLRYDPVGQNPRTGTTSPDVIREVVSAR